MEITFKVIGENEAELEAAVKRILTDFNNYNPHKWSWDITAEARQDDTGNIITWDGVVKATRSAAAEGSGHDETLTW